MSPNAGLGDRWFPKFARLEQEIAGFEREANAIEANAIEANAPQRAGTVTLDGVTDLMEVLAAVVNHLSDGPSCDEVLAWYDGALVKARQHSAYTENLPRRVSVVWNGGKIDREQSSVFIPALARKIQPTQTSGWDGPINDPRSATFQAAA